MTQGILNDSVHVPLPEMIPLIVHFAIPSGKLQSLGRFLSDYLISQHLGMLGLTTVQVNGTAIAFRPRDPAHARKRLSERIDHGSHHLAAGDVRSGIDRVGADVRIRCCLLPRVKGDVMIGMAALVTLLLFIYLLLALLRPEWF